FDTAERVREGTSSEGDEMASITGRSRDIPKAYARFEYKSSGARSIVPEILEPGRRQFGVAHRVLDVLVAEVGLERSRVDAAIGEMKPASMPEHVRVHREIDLGRDAESGHQLAESGGRERRAPLRSEDKRRYRFLFASEPAQRTQFATAEGVNRRRAALGPIHMQPSVTEIDAVPTQSDDLGCPQGVTIGERDGGGVPVAAAVIAGGGDQAGDLGVCQIFAAAGLGIASAARRFPANNCPIYSSWRHQR